MSFINSIGSASPSLPAFQPRSGSPTSAIPARRGADMQPGPRTTTDTTLAEAVLDSSFRIARARAIRAEILNHTYETPERINKTVERLLDVVG